jgi:hypothetical protein
MTIPVDALGHLSLVDPQHCCIDIQARGASVDIGFPDLGSARQAYLAFSTRAGGNRAIALVQRELSRADLALRFTVRGVTVAHLSGDTRGNLVSRALRLNGTDIRWGGMLRAFLGLGRT